MAIDYCDYDDGDGNVCNKLPEVAIKRKNNTLYVCKRCLYMVDVDPEADKVVYLSQYERGKNA